MSDTVRCELLPYETWQDDWPDVRLTGLATNSLLIIPAPPRGDDDPTLDIGWQIRASKTEQGDVLFLTGEIIAPLDNWFATVATGAALHFGRDEYPSMDTDDQIDALLLTYGPWASHPLWDFGRSVLLQAAVSFPNLDLRLPVPTPEHVCVTSEMERKAAARDDEQTASS